MKNLLVLPLAAATLLLAGCGKKESSPAPTADEKSDLQKMVGTVQSMAQSVSQSVNKATANLEQVLPEATKTVTQTVNAVASGDVNTILEQAKKLVGDQKIKEATELVQKLSAIELTTEQKQLLEEIKTLIQKATAAGPLGNAPAGLK